MSDEQRQQGQGVQVAEAQVAETTGDRWGDEIPEGRT